MLQALGRHWYELWRSMVLKPPSRGFKKVHSCTIMIRWDRNHQGWLTPFAIVMPLCPIKRTLRNITTLLEMNNYEFDLNNM